MKLQKMDLTGFIRREQKEATKAVSARIPRRAMKKFELLARKNETTPSGLVKAFVLAAVAK